MKSILTIFLLLGWKFQNVIVITTLRFTSSKLIEKAQTLLDFREFLVVKRCHFIRMVDEG